MARGRKVNSNGERSKQLLREKAIELFSTKGYYQTKISDIVKAANVTQPTFYLYFESKDSLFLDLNEQFQTNLYQNIENVAIQHNSQMPQVLHSIFEYFQENPLLTKIGLYQSEQSHTVKEKLVEILEQIIRKQEQLSDHLDPHIIAECLVGSIERVTLTLLFAKHKTVEELVDQLVSIYYNQTNKVAFLV
ncbi:TetR/AcrR family transcriptional regulator [Lysinibacillus yapensis]|uniref:TetR/AcrR family transcriptional regulator n=1 Tax=Ureibacillus yapensis TaxID=2304605 RepID=A0A396SEL7_9BACL|nr:TetR/AcrR family transcriptional regulator [Lysinibacillus yapensis]RHW39956.1 TetR/AcrR family transcriptional regulator [Lysinibacillus yapensis]